MSTGVMKIGDHTTGGMPTKKEEAEGSVIEEHAIEICKLMKR